MKQIVILISGRGSNMLAIAKNVESGILKDICKIKAVISNNKNALGIQKAKDLGLHTIVLDAKKLKKDYNKELLKTLQDLNPDYIVLAGYMKILPPQIVKAFPKKIINIHPADTALHQGLHGYKWAFDNKLSQTAVTVHYVDEGLDTGKVIAKAIVDIKDAKTLSEVEEKGLKVEHKFYSECLRKIILEENR